MRNKGKNSSKYHTALGNPGVDCDMQGYWIRKKDFNDKSKKIYLKLGDSFPPPDNEIWIYLGTTD